jgi:ubiquinone/menaquinone biosynthesis C-methylase UbiE
MGRARLGEYLLGVQGLALVRTWMTSDAAVSARRIDEIANLHAGLDDGLPSIVLDLPELEVGPGYEAWASTYDDLPNPLVQLEEPLVRALIDYSPPGRALDAACGTGRHTQYLRSLGHAVVGVDAVPAMLERARGRVSDAQFRLGNLEALPIDAASVDVAVCALALTHVADLGPPIAELARVVKPGGRIVVSDLHPFMLLLGGGALFQANDGEYGLVRSYAHQHAAYLTAFRSAGLAVEECFEPTWREEHVEVMAGPLFWLAPEAFRAAMVGLPGALIWDVRR